MSSSRLTVILALVAGCGRFGFGDDGGGGADAAGDGDGAPPGLAHVSVMVTGQGAVQVAGAWCASACAYDLPLGTALAIQAVPRDGQLLAADTSTCAGGACTTLDGDATIAVTFAPAPITANIVFVTSTAPASPLGGLNGANTFCQQRATAAGLTGTFIAMLSTSTANLRDRLAGSRGWVRRDGRAVFDLNTDVLALQVNPITVDESGATVRRNVVPSGTDDAGVAIAGRTCSDWTSTAGNDEIRGTGYAGGIYGISSGGSCSAQEGLYCAQIGKSVAVTPTPWPFGRYAFLSAGNFSASTGLSGADTLCMTEAMAAGLPGTYKALLAGIGTTAASRFASLAGPWRRADGVLLTLGDLATSPIETPLNRDAKGRPTPNSRGWLGAPTPAMVGDAASTCGGWTQTTGGTGNMHRMFDIDEWSTAGNFPCTNVPAGIVCAQE